MQERREGHGLRNVQAFQDYEKKDWANTLKAKP